MSLRPSIPLRCECTRAPLLAMFSIDTVSGEPVVHIKSWKGQKLYTEVLIISGVVKLKCRECSRWNTVRIKKGQPRLEENSGNPVSDL